MTLASRTPIARRLAPVLVAAAFGLAACGGSSDGSSSATTAAGASSTAAATSASSASSGAATTAASSGSSTAGSGAGADKMVAAFAAVEKGECDKATSIGDEMDASGGSDFASFKDLGQGLARLAETGPSELRADFATMSTTFGELVKVYEEFGLEDADKAAEAAKDPDKAARIMAASESMDSAEFTAASERISAWLEKRCPGMG